MDPNPLKLTARPPKDPPGRPPKIRNMPALMRAWREAEGDPDLAAQVYTFITGTAVTGRNLSNRMRRLGNRSTFFDLSLRVVGESYIFRVNISS